MPTIGSATALTATDAAATIDCFDAGTVSFNVVTDGSWNGTLTFEGSSDGTNFRSVNMFNVGTGAFGRTYTTASEGTTWVTPCGGFQKMRMRASTYVAGTATVTPAAGSAAEWGVQMYPYLTTEAGTSVAHGANPTAVAAAVRAPFFANRAGIQFVIGGHPNIISYTQNFTTAQTDTALVTVSAGTIIVCTSLLVTLGNAVTVNVPVRVGFGATVVPAYGTAGIIGSHPNVAAGSGFGLGGGSGIIGIGADGEDLRITCGVPTSGSIDCSVKYFTIAS